MRRPRSTFISAHGIAKGAAVILLLLSATSLRAAASPISILDRADDRPAPATSVRALDIADQTRRFPTPAAASNPVAATPAAANDDATSPAASGIAPPGWSGATSGDPPSNGETVKDVLRSIITWHAAAAPGTAAQRAAQRGFYPMSGSDDGELGVDLRKLILDSEIGGAMLRAIIDVKSADKNGATFSIFGLGNFAIDFAPDLHSAIVSELSSGTAFRMSLSGDRLGFDSYQGIAPGTNPAAIAHENVNLVRLIWNWILDFVSSPVGALLSMSIAISVLVWICVKSVVFLQRRASRYYH